MENLQMSEGINHLMAALAKAQGKIQPASKDKSNPFFKSKYADLSSVWEACRTELSENGLAVVQTIQTAQEGGMYLVTILGHSSGQWMRSVMPIVIAKTDPQSLGSAITYFRRYCLSAMVGVAPDDDDGEKAQSAFRKQEDVKPAVKNISEVEVEELSKLIEGCSEPYKEYFFKSIKKQFNASAIPMIPQDMYSRVKGATLKHIEEESQKEKEKMAQD